MLAPISKGFGRSVSVAGSAAECGGTSDKKHLRESGRCWAVCSDVGRAIKWARAIRGCLPSDHGCDVQLQDAATQPDIGPRGMLVVSRWLDKEVTPNPMFSLGIS